MEWPLVTLSGLEGLVDADAMNTSLLAKPGDVSDEAGTFFL